MVLQTTLMAKTVPGVSKPESLSRALSASQRVQRKVIFLSERTLKAKTVPQALLTRADRREQLPHARVVFLAGFSFDAAGISTA